MAPRLAASRPDRPAGQRSSRTPRPLESERSVRARGAFLGDAVPMVGPCRTGSYPRPCTHCAAAPPTSLAPVPGTLQPSRSGTALARPHNPRSSHEHLGGWMSCVCRGPSFLWPVSRTKIRASGKPQSRATVADPVRTAKLTLMAGKRDLVLCFCRNSVRVCAPRAGTNLPCRHLLRPWKTTVPRFVRPGPKFKPGGIETKETGKEERKHTHLPR